MEPEPVGAHEAGVLAGVAVEVGQRRPVVLARRVGLDEREVPVGLGVAGDPERQLGALGRHRDGAGQALVGRLGRLRQGELGARARLGPDEQVGVDGVVVADALLLVGRRVELADVHRGQVGGHRLVGLPPPGAGAVAVVLGPAEAAVGHDLEPGRRGQLHVEGGLVAGVVVGREPGGGHVGLAHDHRAVVGGDEAGAAALDDVGHAVVGDLHGERRVPGQARLRRHRQLAAVARPGRRLVVHLDRADGHPLEVEVEGREVLQRPGREQRGAGQHVGGGVVGQVEVVLLDLVPAVAVEREVRVADAGRPGRVRRCGLGRGRGQGHQARHEADGGCVREPASHHDAPPGISPRPPAGCERADRRSPAALCVRNRRRGEAQVVARPARRSSRAAARRSATHHWRAAMAATVRVSNSPAPQKMAAATRWSSSDG